MHKDSMDQKNPAGFDDTADLNSKKSAGASDKAGRSERKRNVAAQSGKRDRTPGEKKVNQTWLREIAKTAASTRWKRGD